MSDTDIHCFLCGDEFKEISTSNRQCECPTCQTIFSLSVDGNGNECLTCIKKPERLNTISLDAFPKAKASEGMIEVCTNDYESCDSCDVPFIPSTALELAEITDIESIKKMVATIILAGVHDSDIQEEAWDYIEKHE